jgi:5-(carboxyamino)imidazole ribonucleotide synthase
MRSCWTRIRSGRYERPKVPLARIGVLGGGQLGRMLALAGIPLGLSFRFYEPGDPSPVARLGDVVCSSWGDRAALTDFARGLDVCTYEVENVPVEAAELVSTITTLRPSRDALACGRDRFAEKQLFEQLAIPTPAWRPVTKLSELVETARVLGLPLLVKVRTLGYDGRGVFVARFPADLESAWTSLGGADAVAEAMVTYDRELSVLAVRGEDGSDASYPVVENVHVEGILHSTRVPAPGLSEEVVASARDAARRIVRHLDYVGVLALELFQCGNQLLANEIAPRVHNSGHWTIDAAEMSQFENHLRAILGLPLGSTGQTARAAMVNLIGHVPAARSLLLPGVHLHDYGKTPRPNRKVGHVTITASDDEQLAARLSQLRQVLAQG